MDVQDASIDGQGVSPAPSSQRVEDSREHGGRLEASEREPAVGRVRRRLARLLDSGTCHALVGQRIVLGCSGGGDSLCLLDALAYLATPRHIQLVVVHVDHGLREGSEQESERVEAVARSHDVPFVSLKVVVSKEKGVSVQAAARDARHNALEAEMRRQQATWVVLGHTSDDQAETVLMRLAQGAPLPLLSGMHWLDGVRAHPLLSTSRDETHDYCRARGLEWWSDPSNEDPHYLRVAVRQEILPPLVTRFPGAVRSICKVAAAIEEATRSHEA